jgi:hypothetical protein
MLSLRKRRAIHFAFSAATVVAVIFGTFGPAATAAVGWLLSLALITGWFTFAAVDTKRRTTAN